MSKTSLPVSRKPSEVFTPRAAQVNDTMYVHRPKLEERLIDAIEYSKYIVIHGESGNGKTWLYKRVFSANDVHYDIVNLAQVVVTGSLDSAFREKLGDFGYSQVSAQETNTTVGFKPIADHSMKTTQLFPAKGAFVALLERIRYRANGKKAVLVLDNFESIIGDDAALKQLGALIISADEEAVAKHNVQVVIVGVPGNLKETISRLNNAGPIANRLIELPEVARMTEREAVDLIERGFRQLELIVDDDIRETLFATISWKTDRIAQHIHEICLIISQNAFRNDRVINQAVVDKATATWIDDSLSSDLALIESAMNARDTRAGRKNQVLFAMGQCKTEDFKYSDIETLVRGEFSVGAATLNVSAILSGFGGSENPIIRRTPKQDAWRFSSPKLKMAIRAKLVKNADGKVSLVN